MSQRTASGFTLVELLVVIAIIAVLAGLLLPAMSNAKERARTAICISNQRQLHLGWFIYAQQHDGTLPGNTDSGGLFEQVPVWVSGHMGYENDSFAPILTDSTNTLLLNPGRHGSIGPFVGSAKVYRCPSDRSWIARGGTRFPRVRSYSMNNFVGNVHLGTETTYKGFFKEADLLQVDASSIYVFIDHHEDSIRGSFFDFSMQDRFFSIPASRHSGGAVVSYADGNIALKKWKDPRTKVPVTHKRIVGSSSPNNPDIGWLKVHSTVPK
ncbi:MAG TPA: type II secretion system protein [Verrucomicrobiae bacterium]